MPKPEIIRKGSALRIEKRKDLQPFVVTPFSMGLKPGIDPERITQYADEMCDEEKLSKSSD